MEISLDNGQTWQPAPAGIVVRHAALPLPGSSQPGRLELSLDHTVLRVSLHGATSSKPLLVEAEPLAHYAETLMDRAMLRAPVDGGSQPRITIDYTPAANVDAVKLELLDKELVQTVTLAQATPLRVAERRQRERQQVIAAGCLEVREHLFFHQGRWQWPLTATSSG